MHKFKFKIKKFLKNNFYYLLWSGVVFGVLISIFMPKIIHYSETPEFCVKCHSMKTQYEAFIHSKHRNFKCVDCHLPNDNFVNHYIWKGIDGTKDVISETLGLKEDYEIKLSKHGHKVLQSNCIRCHKDMVSHINTQRACIDCHRIEMHKNTAVICSFNTEVKNEKNK